MGAIVKRLGSRGPAMEQPSAAEESGGIGSAALSAGACHITIDNVPAWICEQCGEPLFEEREVEAIQDIIKAVEEKSRLLQRSA